MQMEDYDHGDGRKVWLRPSEISNLIDETQNTEQKIALGLMARSGLRSEEATNVRPDDIITATNGQTYVRVQSGKGDKYRETPLPDGLRATINAYADVRDESHDTPLVMRPTRTVRRWTTKAAQKRREATQDDGWQYVAPHDLRRSWGQLLVENGVEHGLIMAFGGWESWETFRDAYLGQYSLKAKQEAVEKVDWL